MYEKLIEKLKEKRKEIEIEEDSTREYFYWELKDFIPEPQADEWVRIKEIQWLKLIALGKALPSCDQCCWYRSDERLCQKFFQPNDEGGILFPIFPLEGRESQSKIPWWALPLSRSCYHPKARGLKDPKWIGIEFSQKEIPEIIRKLCPYFEPSYKLKTVGVKEAQREILERLKKEVIVAGGWAREIILDIPRYHNDIDILVEEANWPKVQKILRDEWFEIEEIKPEKWKAKRAMVTIDITLVVEDQGEEFYTLPIYVNDNYYYGSFQLPKEGFEKRQGFTVMSLELQWLTLSPGRRTKKAKKLAKLLNQQKIKKLDAKLSFEASVKQRYT